jgi:tRNA C32,U32 (ribose-2'-O)-methylase TrmJ
LKLKLDENLGHRARALLEAAGHDVAILEPDDARTCLAYAHSVIAGDTLEALRIG